MVCQTNTLDDWGGFAEIYVWSFSMIDGSGFCSNHIFQVGLSRF